MSTSAGTPPKADKPPRPVLRTLGRNDRVDFPELELFDIDTKVDTGARTSAIHCHSVRLIDTEAGPMVRFNLLDPTHPSYEERELRLPLLSQRVVRNSFGHTEARYVVGTTLRMFGQDFLIELSLANRSSMDFPVLLGRQALARRFSVDVSRTMLSHKHKRKAQRAAANANSVKTIGPAQMPPPTDL